MGKWISNQQLAIVSSPGCSGAAALSVNRHGRALPHFPTFLLPYFPTAPLAHLQKLPNVLNQLLHLERMRAVVDAPNVSVGIHEPQFLCVQKRVGCRQ